MSSDRILETAKQGDTETLKYLLQQRQLSDRVCDRFGATCCHYAARSGQLETLKWLILGAGLTGSKRTRNGANPSHDAAAAGKLKCLQWLLQDNAGGCWLNDPDNSGCNVLHLSARFGHLSLLHWLVEDQGMDVTKRAGNGISAIHFAAARGDKNCLIYLLQKAPSLVNNKADNGATPIYFAAQDGHLECIQYLVHNGSGNVHLKANDGMQPIHAAAQMGHLNVVEWLVREQGVSAMEKDNDGATPIHFAASRGHTHILKWLLSHGGGCEPDSLGGTPLHDAAEHGQLESLHVLVEFGCDVNIEDKDGLVASDLAKACGNNECAKYLRSVEKKNLRSSPIKNPQVRTSSSSSNGTGVYAKHVVEVQHSPRQRNLDVTDGGHSSQGNCQDAETGEGMKRPPLVRDRRLDSPPPVVNGNYSQPNINSTHTVVIPPAPDLPPPAPPAQNNQVFHSPKKENITNGDACPMSTHGKYPPNLDSLMYVIQPNASPSVNEKEHKSPPQAAPKPTFPLQSSTTTSNDMQSTKFNWPPPAKKEPQKPTPVIQPPPSLNHPSHFSSSTVTSPPPQVQTSSVPPAPPPPPPPNQQLYNANSPSRGAQWKENGSTSPASTMSSSTVSSQGPLTSDMLAEIRAGPSLQKISNNVGKQVNTENNSVTPHDDIMAEIKAGKSLQRDKPRSNAVSKRMDIDINSATPTGEGGKVFSAKDVIDQIPKTDDGGRPIPEWKRQIMARKAAEQATKEAAENMKKKKLEEGKVVPAVRKLYETREEEQENKYKNLPAWKADLLRKKEEAAAQERKEEEERKRRLEEDRQRAARLEKERKKQNRSGALKPWEKEIQKAREGSEEQYV